jgi:hypothetical protein
MMKTRVSTLPMACERGATSSNVSVATWMSMYILTALLASGRPIRALAIGRVRNRRILRCSIVSR